MVNMVSMLAKMLSSVCPDSVIVFFIKEEERRGGEKYIGQQLNAAALLR